MEPLQGSWARLAAHWLTQRTSKRVCGALHETLTYLTRGRARQALARVTPLRDFFLLPANYAACRAPLVQRFGELLRKAWNTRNFKGQVGVGIRVRAPPPGKAPACPAPPRRRAGPGNTHEGLGADDTPGRALLAAWSQGCSSIVAGGNGLSQ